MGKPYILWLHSKEHTLQVRRHSFWGTLNHLGHTPGARFSGQQRVPTFDLVQRTRYRHLRSTEQDQTKKPPGQAVYACLSVPALPLSTCFPSPERPVR